MEKAADTKIVLSFIKCISTSEPGKDEVYLEHADPEGRARRYPETGYESMAPGGVWKVGIELIFKSSVTVSLYDNDGVFNDFLGGHTYYPNDSQPASVVVSNSNGARYELYTEQAPSA